VTYLINVQPLLKMFFLYHPHLPPNYIPVPM